MIEVIDGGDEAAMQAACKAVSNELTPHVMRAMRDEGPQVVNGVMCDFVGDLTAFTLMAWMKVEQNREMTAEQFTAFASRVTARICQTVADELTGAGAFTQVTDCTEKPPAGNN